jgi:hypothetical protein
MYKYGGKVMTPELERHLQEMGVVVKQPKVQVKQDDRLDYSFKDPRDVNGEVPF